MDTEEELNEKIMKITMVIHENYPELSKFLNEMPVTIPIINRPEVKVHNLENYYNSLVSIFRNYVAEHQLVNSNRKNDHHL